VHVGIGICMDINPYEYIDWNKFEFANFHLQRDTKLLLLLANWLGTNAEDNFSAKNYWLSRLMPLWNKDCYFVCCNRIGEERGSTFCGNSCVISLQRKMILGSLSSVDEGILRIAF